MRKILSLLLVLAMTCTMLGAVALAEEPDFSNGFVFNIVAPIAPDGSEAKWTEETTPDGWVKVTNPDGATLGYDPASGESEISYVLGQLKLFFQNIRNNIEGFMKKLLPDFLADLLFPPEAEEGTQKV